MSTYITAVVQEANYFEGQGSVLLSKLDHFDSQDDSKIIFAYGEEWPMDNFKKDAEEAQKLRLEIEKNQGKVSSLVQEFNLVRCVYCNEWTHEKIKGIVPYVNRKIYCSESCKKAFNDHIF